MSAIKNQLRSLFPLPPFDINKAGAAVAAEVCTFEEPACAL